MNENMLPVGTLLMNGIYRIEKQIGAGGFGNTYVVKNLSSDRVYAMKEFFMKDINLREGMTVTVSIPGQKSTFEIQRSKFKKEAQRLCSLDNPHLVKVYDLFEENGTVYYVMDFIDGKSLADWVKDHGRMREHDVMDVFCQMLDALSLLHSQKPALLHLDIKPANIMLDKSDNAFLLDFGSSKQVESEGGFTTVSGFTLSKLYAPSELIDGRKDRIGAWTDLYELGATLYYLLTGKQPPTSSEIAEGMEAFVFPDSVSERTRELILWLMSLSPIKRPQSVANVKKWFEENNIYNEGEDTNRDDETVFGGSGTEDGGDDETILDDGDNDSNEGDNDSNEGDNSGDETVFTGDGKGTSPILETPTPVDSGKNNNLIFALLGLVVVGFILFLIFGGNHSNQATADSYYDTDSIAEVEDSVMVDSAVVSEDDMDEKYAIIERISQAIIDGNANDLIYMTEYPILRDYPLKDIRNDDEMIAYFNTLFDATIKNKLRNATKEDWNEVGYRGYYFNINDDSGIWVGENLRLYSVRYMSSKEKALYKQKVKEDLETLPSSLREGGWTPYLCYMDIEDGSILRIDRVSEKLRLTVFSRASSLQQSELCLYGKRDIQGSMGLETDIFTDGKVSYDIDVTGNMEDGKNYVSVEDKNTNKSWTHEIKKCYWLDLISSSPKVSEQAADQIREAVETTIHGHVKDDTGDDFIAVTVRVKGTNVGSITDFSGNFSLKCKPGATLVFTYEGFTPLEMPAKDGMEVTLK